MDSVESLLGVRAPFAYPVFGIQFPVPDSCPGSAVVLAVFAPIFGYILMHFLPPRTRTDGSLLTSLAGEWASVKTRTRGSAFDRANTPLCYRGTPDIYVLTCVDALLVRG